MAQNIDICPFTAGTAPPPPRPSRRVVLRGLAEVRSQQAGAVSTTDLQRANRGEGIEPDVPVGGTTTLFTTVTSGSSVLQQGATFAPVAAAGARVYRNAALAGLTYDSSRHGVAAAFGAAAGVAVYALRRDLVASAVVGVLGFGVFQTILNLNGPTEVMTAPLGDGRRISRARLREMAEQAPAQLVGLVKRGAAWKPADLSYAAEIIGGLRTSEATSALLDLLDHPSAVVREGAVYGLARRVLDPRAVAALRKVSTFDPSEAVRIAAQGALDD
jgi:hypothetical protein